MSLVVNLTPLGSQHYTRHSVAFCLCVQFDAISTQWLNAVQKLPNRTNRSCHLSILPSNGSKLVHESYLIHGVLSYVVPYILLVLCIIFNII